METLNNKTLTDNQFLNTDIESKVNEFISGLKTSGGTDIAYHVEIEDIDFDNPFESISDMLNEHNSLDVDIIYYGSAMEYLTENDTSLTESLEIAIELGYEVSNLNSEVLASLLATRNNKESFDELETEIEQFFEGINEEIEEFQEWLDEQEY